MTYRDPTDLMDEIDYEPPEHCPRCGTAMSYEVQAVEWTCPECGLQISEPPGEPVELPF